MIRTKSKAFGSLGFFWGLAVTGMLVEPSPARLHSAETLEVADFDVELIAIGSLPGTARDFSGFTGKYEEGTPCDQIGGFSAIEYTGRANRYWILADRGPADGAASFHCRLHEVVLDVNRQTRNIAIELQSTTPLFSAENRPLLGSIPRPTNDRSRPEEALDPEGMRLLPDGNFAISEEYGPAIDLFSLRGVRQRTLGLPTWMQLTREPDLEKAEQGAMPNRGLEGLTLTSDRSSLVAAMQGPLVQDSFSDGKKRYARYTRLVQVPIERQAPVKQWLYPLADLSSGVSEILMVDKDRYLVLERDGEVRSDAKYKAIYLIDARGATDVADRDKLDPRILPPDIHAVRKLGEIDLLDSRFDIPKRFSLEKPEGLAWGENLPDGRRTLIVCFDNDFMSDQDSLFLAFALKASSKP